MLNFFPVGHVDADVYIGTGAGTLLYNEIKKAHTDIKVVSPFLTPDFIDLLVDKANSGVTVTLITNDMNSNRRDVTGHKEIIYKILQQEKCVDDNAIARRKKGKIIYTVWLIFNVLVTLGIAFLYWRLFNRAINPLLTLRLLQWQTTLTLILPLFFSYVINISLLKKIKRTRVYNYCYSHAFDFKIFKNNRKGDIHAKIYCLDDKKAYLGSLNFTKNGFENFFETCITINDRASVLKISQNITQLFFDSERESYSDYELEYLYYRWSEHPY